MDGTLSLHLAQGWSYAQNGQKYLWKHERWSEKGLILALLGVWRHRDSVIKLPNTAPVWTSARAGLRHSPKRRRRPGFGKALGGKALGISLPLSLSPSLPLSAGPGKPPCTADASLSHPPHCPPLPVSLAEDTLLLQCSGLKRRRSVCTVHLPAQAANWFVASSSDVAEHRAKGTCCSGEEAAAVPPTPPPQPRGQSCDQAQDAVVWFT